MCRHLLPRLDFPVGQILHAVGRVVASHPVALSAVILVPLCAVIAVLAVRHLERRAVLRWRVPRIFLAGRSPMLLRDGYGPAPSA